MSYIVRADIEAKFGVVNVAKWASLSATDGSTEITARVNAAIARATDEVNDRLRGGYYVVPFTSPYPSDIVELAATVAGLWLHDARGVEDMDANGKALDRLSVHRKLVEDHIAMLRTGERRLDTTVTYESMPSAGIPEVVTLGGLSPFKA